MSKGRGVDVGGRAPNCAESRGRTYERLACRGMPSSSGDGLLALLVLSSSSERGSRLRCFQRTTLHALSETTGQQGGWRALRGGGQVLVRYIVSRPDQSLQLARKRRKSPEASVEALQRAQVALERESMRHADLFMADVPEGPTTCAVKLFMGLRQLLAMRPRAQFVGCADDDAFLHPPRLAQDLLEFVDHPRQVVYGQIGIAGGWSDANDYHYGWGFYMNRRNVLNLHRLRQRHIARGDPGPGPFVLPYGFCLILSHGAAEHATRAALVSSLVTRLVARARRQQRRDVPNLCAKCRPGADGALGWALSQVRPRLNLTVVDVTYGKRLLLWRGSRAQVDLGKGAAVLHTASKWREHFQFALCAADEGRGAGKERPDQAMIFRCEGGGEYPATNCGAAGCEGKPRMVLPKGSTCLADAECAANWRNEFGSVAMCYAVGRRDVAHVPSSQPSLCQANESEVLRRCGG